MLGISSNTQNDDNSYLVLVWSHAEVLDGLSGVLWSSQKQGVAASWGSQGQLIQGQDLTSSSDDAGASSGGESESSDAELRNGQETVVIGDGANNNDGLVVGLVGDVRSDPGNGDWRSVDARHKKSAEDNLVEGRFGSA